MLDSSTTQYPRQVALKGGKSSCFRQEKISLEGILTSVQQYKGVIITPMRDKISSVENTINALNKSNLLL